MSLTKSKIVSSKYVIIIAAFLFLQWPCTLFGQNKKDSIRQKIASASNDSIKAEAYNDLGYEYYYYEIDSLKLAVKAAENAFATAKRGKHLTPMISSLNLKSKAYSEMGKYQKAEQALKQAIPFCQENKDRKREYQIKDNMANIVYELGRKDEALALKLKALDVFKELKDSNSVMIAQFGIAWIYMNDGKDLMAKKGFFDCIPLGEKINSPALIETYGNLGIIYERLNILDSAIYHLQKAAEIGKEYPTFFLQNQLALSKVYGKTNNKQKALKILLDVHKEYAANSDEKDYQIVKMLIANYYLEEDKLSEAQKYLKGINKEIVLNDLQSKRKLGAVGYNIYNKKGEYKKALEYYTILRDAIDSSSNARRDSSFKLIESKYNVAKKQETINTQKLKLRNYSLGLLGFLALAVMAGLLFYNYKRKNAFEKKLSSEVARNQKVEIESLKKENKIISMQSMLEGQEEERKRIARDLHDNIGTLMTSIKMKVLSIQKEVQDIEKMNITGELDNMIDNASQEVRRISHSMTPVALDISGLPGAIRDLEPQLAAKNIDFKANIDVLQKIEDQNLSINIYRIVQEIFNNIVKHSEAKSVSLDASMLNDNLVLRIRDNGIGISKKVWNEAKSVGVESLKSRVNYLNGEIKLVPDDGTHYKITIPIS